MNDGCIMLGPNEVVVLVEQVSFMTSVFFSFFACYTNIILIFDLSARPGICCDGWFGRRQDCELAGEEHQLEE
jgi:hypothetical protein